jgi:hypothetical protein
MIREASLMIRQASPDDRQASLVIRHAWPMISVWDCLRPRRRHGHSGEALLTERMNNLNFTAG